MKKRPRRTKGTQNKNKIKYMTDLGACVSVDQIESPIPVLISQPKGGITQQHYRTANIFEDHASRLGYVHRQKSLTLDKTVESKKASEAYNSKNGFVLRH